MKEVIKGTLITDCPIRNVLARVSSKWSLVVMSNLNENGIMRYSALRHEIPDISQKVLTATLRALVVDGFVARKVYPEVPPRVEYRLTERGSSFMSYAQLLIDWAFNNMSAIVSDRQRNEEPA